MAAPRSTLDAIAAALRGFGMAIELRKHQLEALERIFTAERLRTRTGVIVADEMGLGKTITAIAFGLMCQRYSPSHRRPATLVAVPSPLADQWRSEVERAVTPPEGRRTVHLYRGSSRARDFPEGEADDFPCFVVATYDALKADWCKGDVDRGPWAVPWHGLVADEAHDFRNPKTRLFQAMERLSASSTFPLALTGTPVNNGVADAATMLRFCKVDVPRDVRHLARSGVIVRRRRADVFSSADLPAAHAHVIYHPLCDAELMTHDAFMHRICASPAQRFAQVLVSLLRGRQVCVSASLVAQGGEEAWLPEGYVSSRTRVLASIVEDAVLARRERVLVFSQWSRALREGAQKVRELVPESRSAVYDGSLSQAERCEALRRLETGEVDVLWLSYAVGNKGLNVTCANHVILLDPWWNPFVEDQAVGRCHRLGQTREVHTYRMLSQGTFEEYMCRVIQPQKRQASQAVLSDEDVAEEVLSAGFSRKDLERAMGFMRACSKRFLRAHHHPTPATS